MVPEPWGSGTCQLPWAGAIVGSLLCDAVPPPGNTSGHSLFYPVICGNLFPCLKCSCPFTASCSTRDAPKNDSWNCLTSSLLLIRRQVASYAEHYPTNNFPAIRSMGRQHTDSTFPIAFVAICFVSNSLLARLKVKITHSNLDFHATDRNLYR